MSNSEDDRSPALLDNLKKQIGRSTRMMLHAIELAKQGRAVYVCVVNRAQIHSLERIREEHCPQATGIQYDTVAHLDIDWDRLSLRGAHPNCVLLVDHAVIQWKFSRVLQMYEQYDSDTCAKWVWDRGEGTTVNGKRLPCRC